MSRSKGLPLVAVAALVLQSIVAAGQEAGPAQPSQTASETPTFRASVETVVVDVYDLDVPDFRDAPLTMSGVALKDVFTLQADVGDRYRSRNPVTHRCARRTFAPAERWCNGRRDR